LDGIKAHFRFCAGCQLFVGRACCWNPDAVACVVDAPLLAPTAALRASLFPYKPDDAEAQRSLSELARSIETLEQPNLVAGPLARTESDLKVRRAQWDDTWWAIGWLVARVETNRDAAAKAIWRIPASESALSNGDLSDQLASLDERYVRVRARIEAAMLAAGESSQDGRRMRVDRTRVAVGAFAAVAVVLVAVIQPWNLSVFTNGSATASRPEGAVLGGAAGPSQSNGGAPTPLPDTPQAVIATVDFDELRIGQLAGATQEIGSVKGGAEVIPFPSPFDRSIRVVGDGSHTFCVPVAKLRDGAIAVAMDVYFETPIASGRLTLSVTPPGFDPKAVRVPLRQLRGLKAEAWHRLRAIWTPGRPVAIAIGDPSAGPLETMDPLPADVGHSEAGSVCVAVSDMANDAVLLLDNLQVQR
jgi:hypothetical protein